MRELRRIDTGNGAPAGERDGVGIQSGEIIVVEERRKVFATPALCLGHITINLRELLRKQRCVVGLDRKRSANPS
jgi:hypothetical protein